MVTTPFSTFKHYLVQIHTGFYDLTDPFRYVLYIPQHIRVRYRHFHLPLDNRGEEEAVVKT